MHEQTFSKEERLSSKKKIDLLFADGKGFNLYPFRAIWIFSSNEHENLPAQILISVSKKKIKKAITRNLIKRRIREGYRKNKSGFYTFLTKNNINCTLALVYIASDIALYKEIEQKIILVLQRLESEYEKSIG